MAEPDESQVTAERLLALPEIVWLPAEIDIVNCVAVGDDLIGAFRPGVSVVIADLSASHYCDSAAMRQLVIASNHAVCVGAQLRVVVSSPVLRHIMDVTGVDQMLRMYPDMASALTGAPQTRERPGETERH